MIPYIGVKIQGKTFYPLYNIGAAVTLNERYSDHNNLVEDLVANTEEGYKLAFDVFSRLCEEGNAVRRAYGYDPGAVPDWDEAWLEYMVADADLMRRSIVDAILLGTKNEVEDADGTDLWLEELEKKTRTT